MEYAGERRLILKGVADSLIIKWRQFKINTMLTELLNELILKRLNLLPFTALSPVGGGRMDAYSRCYDGSCSGDCVGGCDGDARGDYGSPCYDGSCSGDCVGGCSGTPAGGF